MDAKSSEDQSPAVKWVTQNALFAPLNGTIWMSALVAWTAIGMSAAAATAGALGLCLVVPIIGWFFGIPIVLAFALAGACVWAAGYVAIFAAWGITTLAMAAFTYCYQRLASSS